MPKERLPLFADLVNCDFQVFSHGIWITPKEKTNRKTVPYGVLAAAFMLRNALSYATMHHVPSRGVFNLDGRFVGYLLYIHGAMEPTLDGELGSTAYLKESCGFGELYVDFRGFVLEKFAEHSHGGSLSAEVRKWRFRTISHKESRKLNEKGKSRRVRLRATSVLRSRGAIK